MTMQPLLTAWKSFQPQHPPFILPGDEEVLSDPKLFRQFADWDSFILAHEFGFPGQSYFHIGLLPMPFVGNLKTASVYLLGLNPGFGPTDYFGEYNVPDYRSLLLGNLHQVQDCLFFFLDPRFSWHGGFEYWHTKLQNTIVAFANCTGIKYDTACRFFQSRIAALELVPYHSETFKIPNRVLNSLLSVRLMQEFVLKELLPRAESGDCLIVVTRGVKYWKLPKVKNVITYTANEARGAHLSPQSSGGSAILKFLYSKY
jgi:hypothetical protein